MRNTPSVIDWPMSGSFCGDCILDELWDDLLWVWNMIWWAYDAPPKNPLRPRLREDPGGACATASSSTLEIGGGTAPPKWEREHKLLTSSG
eukprot:scaffold499696_cov47-Attheya_sp.AAC.1